MPSLNDTLIPAEGLAGYAHVAPPASPVAAPAPSSTMEPGRNTMIRCPLPALWSVSPDSLRQFYIDGQVPQVRLMLPAAPATGSVSVATTQNVSVTSGSSSSSSTSQAAQAVVTTPVLPPGSKYVGTILLSKSFQLLSITVQSPCRVQLYGTAAAQSSDVSRGLDSPPAAGTAQNIICDVVLDTVPYKWSFQNRVGANADSSQSAKVYVTITNLAPNSDTETLTVQYVALES